VGHSGAQKSAISGAKWDLGMGYYDGLIGSRMRIFDWYQNQ